MNLRNLWPLFTELTQSNRPIRLRLSHHSAVLDEVLLVKYVSGQEALCGGIEYRLLCVSLQAALPLKEFIALPVQLQFVTDRGHLRSVCGIVAQASAGQSDGGLATYQLVVRDALALMEQRINTRIFRNANAVDVSAALMREWRHMNPVLAMTFDIDTSGITKTYPAREFTMQHNESDAAFLRRLWKRQGIAWFVRPGLVGESGKSITPGHTLVLFDVPQSLVENAAGTVRFHRDAGTEVRDGVINWSAVRNLKAGGITRQCWDYRQGRMMWAHSPTNMQQGKAGDQFAFSLDDYQIDPPHVGDNGDDYRRLGELRIQRQVWYPETGLDHHSLTFAINGLRMQPAFRVVKTKEELKAEGAYLPAPETIAVATTWHPLIPSVRRAETNEDLRAKAGDPCPKAGIWQPMDVNATQRVYRSGEPMANLGSAYGLTVWRWVADR